jgi:hypothetical protein
MWKKYPLRTSSIQHRSQFFRGAFLGVMLVVIKLVFFLPINVADILYGAALLVTLVITAGELLQSRYFVLEARVLDFVVGFLFPLDCYAVLILFGVPLTN